MIDLTDNLDRAESDTLISVLCSRHPAVLVAYRDVHGLVHVSYTGEGADALGLAMEVERRLLEALRKGPQ